jgi:branched-chain amino acid transport system ATP-binding protein
MIVLETENLTKKFGGLIAINEVSMHVAEGEIVGLIGPNGAGKTTLFNLITGQLQRDLGKIFFKGEDIGALPAYEICRRGIARSFQIVNIFPRLTVFGNVQVAVLSQQKRSYDLFSPAGGIAVEKTRSLLESVGLAGKSENIAGSLSHGDQKILEIAIALGNEPELLILDEPTAGMSPEETAATMELIRRLARSRGLTILFCEHDMEIVFSISQSIMVMHQGRTLIQERPEEVRRNKEVQEAYLGGE